MRMLVGVSTRHAAGAAVRRKAAAEGIVFFRGSRFFCPFPAAFAAVAASSCRMRQRCSAAAVAQRAAAPLFAALPTPGAPGPGPLRGAASTSAAQTEWLARVYREAARAASAAAGTAALRANPRSAEAHRYSFSPGYPGKERERQAVDCNYREACSSSSCGTDCCQRPPAAHIVAAARRNTGTGAGVLCSHSSRRRFSILRPAAAQEDTYNISFGSESPVPPRSVLAAALAFAAVPAPCGAAPVAVGAARAAVGSARAAGSAAAPAVTSAAAPAVTSAAAPAAISADAAAASRSAAASGAGSAAAAVAISATAPASAAPAPAAGAPAPAAAAPALAGAAPALAGAAPALAAAPASSAARPVAASVAAAAPATSAARAAAVADLRERVLQAASEFKSSVFRKYFERRAREDFDKMQQELPTAKEKDVQQFLQQMEAHCALLQRQSTVANIYHVDKMIYLK